MGCRRPTAGGALAMALSSLGGAPGGAAALQPAGWRAAGSQASALRGPPEARPFPHPPTAGPDAPALGAARLAAPAAWAGEDPKGGKWCGHRLSDEDVDDHRATEAAKASGAVQWRAPGAPEAVAREAIPLGLAMRQNLAEFSEELVEGKGLAMIRNMPVQDPRFGEDDIAVAYLGLSAHLVSIRAAPQGGASRVCSVPAVHNTMVERYPELAEAASEAPENIAVLAAIAEKTCEVPKKSALPEDFVYYSTFDREVRPVLQCV